MLKRGLIYLGLATICFSTMELTGKIVSLSLHPVQITFWRFAIGSLILFPIALREIRQRELKLKLEDFAYFSGLGLLCIVVCMSFFQTAILYSPASTVAVVFSANPVFTIPFSALFLNERISARTILALILGLVGVLIIMKPFSCGSSLNLTGVLLAFLAAVTWSLYTVLGKRRISRYGGIVQNCFSFAIGNFGLLVLFVILKIPLLSGISPANLWPLLYMGVFVSGLGFFFYFQGMGYTSASMGSAVFFIKPALASILAVSLIGETLGPELLAGIVLIVAASVCLYKRPSRSSAAPEKR